MILRLFSPLRTFRELAPFRLAYLEIAGQEGEPIPVFRNPITWLLAGGAGIAILDWSWMPELLLGHELIAEDLDLGERLDAALKPNISIGRAAP